MKVLITDDSGLVRDRLVALISEIEGVELVSQASNAAEALMAVRHSRPDVVILDIRMPGISGIQLLKTIRAITLEPVIIMLTAYANPQYRSKCMRLGADYFLDKDMEFDRVAEVLQHVGTRAVAASR